MGTITSGTEILSGRDAATLYTDTLKNLEHSRVNTKKRLLHKLDDRYIFMQRILNAGGILQPDFYNVLRPDCGVPRVLDSISALLQVGFITLDSEGTVTSTGLVEALDDKPAFLSAAD